MSNVEYRMSNHAAGRVQLGWIVAATTVLVLGKQLSSAIFDIRNSTSFVL
jgi:hypothetical protein